MRAPSHTTALTKMIDSVLRLSGLTLDDIDMYAASVGPGSFTGVRIGVSVIKGFAFVDSKLCVGVSSLDALAYGALGCRGIITPVIDARRGTFYTSAYLSDGKQATKLTSEGQLEIFRIFRDNCRKSERTQTRPDGGLFRENSGKSCGKRNFGRCRDIKSRIRSGIIGVCQI